MNFHPKVVRDRSITASLLSKRALNTWGLDVEFGLRQSADQTPLMKEDEIGRFFASLRFENREKLDQLGLEPGYFEFKKGE